MEKFFDNENFGVINSKKNQINNDGSEINLKVNGNNSQKQKNKKDIFVDFNSAQIENFLISEKPYQQLSDHFGLSIDLKFLDRIFE